MNYLHSRFFSQAQKSKYTAFATTFTTWILFGCIIGVVAGSASAMLLNVNDFVTKVREKNPFLLFLLPLGGVVIGFLYNYFGKDSGKGNELIIEHINKEEGIIPLRMGPIVFISTFITILLGGSTGREGAAIQMGTSIAEGVNRLFRINKVDRRLLIISGISGGFGSAFGMPLAGALFGMEVLAVGKIRYDAIVPCFVSSFVGHLTTMAWGVKHDHFEIKSVPGLTPETFIKVFFISIAFCAAGVLYTQLRHGVQNISMKYLKNPMLRGLVGGLIIVALAYLIGSRDYLGRGLPMLEKAFKGPVPYYAFFAKLIFTAVTMGSGFRGGEVIPLFFVGATLGNTLSVLLNLPTSFLAGLGLIAVFSSVANAPISCLLMSMELFKGKGIEYFLMAIVICYVFSGHHGIYVAQEIYEPKSRMLNIVDGQTIAEVEKAKRNNTQ